jgi:hypothetical protein
VRRVRSVLVHWAPELLEGEEPTQAADVYGLAATICTLMTGIPHRLAAPVGQQVCFMVGVLVERTTGGPTLVQTGLTCATAR